jgi:hypothetical protein
MPAYKPKIDLTARRAKKVRQSIKKWVTVLYTSSRNMPSDCKECPMAAECIAPSNPCLSARLSGECWRQDHLGSLGLTDVLKIFFYEPRRKFSKYEEYNGV